MAQASAAIANLRNEAPQSTATPSVIRKGRRGTAEARDLEQELKEAKAAQIRMERANPALRADAKARHQLLQEQLGISRAYNASPEGQQEQALTQRIRAAEANRPVTGLGARWPFTNVDQLGRNLILRTGAAWKSRPGLGGAHMAVNPFWQYLQTGDFDADQLSLMFGGKVSFDPKRPGQAPRRAPGFGHGAHDAGAGGARSGGQPGFRRS